MTTSRHHLLSLATSVACALSWTGATSAQSVPRSETVDAFELSGASPTMLMSRDARIQQFFEAAEVGSSTVTMRALSLRFDGPSAAAQSVAHTIGQLTIRVGATGHDVDQLTAHFGFNLTAPLQPAFQASAHTFHTDANAPAGVEAWGGSAGDLRFVFPAPITVQIPAGGCLAIEILVENNSNGAAQDVARLDLGRDRGVGFEAGKAITEGHGCPYPQRPLSIDTVGQYESGTAFFVSGHGFPPNTPVGLLLTETLVPQPWIIPGTPACWIYVDLATGFLLPLQMSTPSGDLPDFRTGSGVPLPRSPRLRGSVLYVQAVAPLPTSPGGVVTSDYRTIKLGATPSPRLRAWHVANHADADALVGSATFAGALAMRIE